MADTVITRIALRVTGGKFISFQPDGSIQIRDNPNDPGQPGAYETIDVLLLDGGVPVLPSSSDTNNVVVDPTIPPENIRTADQAQVSLRVKWWLNHFGHPEDYDYWMGVIMDTMYHEGHTPGWTPDSYWPDKMRDGYNPFLRPADDRREQFMAAVAGKPFGQQTLLDLEPMMNAAGWQLTPPNSVGDRTKIHPPEGPWTRVGFGEGHWVWLPQPQS